jgi:predicted DNA-binding transcriptional regulator YafY
MKILLRKALETKEPTRIFYMDKKGNVSERIIRIESIKEEQIRAYCFYRKQNRTFLIGNILSLGPVKRKRMGA